MTTAVSGVNTLPPEWATALAEVASRRSKRHYKPAALLVSLDMIDDGASNGERVVFDPYKERFKELVGRFDAQGAVNGWQPFLHLATGNQVWDLYSDGRRVDLDTLLTNRTKASVERNVDEARIRSHLVPFLKDQAGEMLFGLRFWTLFDAILRMSPTSFTPPTSPRVRVHRHLPR